MNMYLAVFVSGGLGAVSRYAVTLALKRPALSHFAYGTITVNVVGSLLIGLLGAALVARSPERVALRETVMVGYLGGFTTFSAFSADTLRHVHEGEAGKAMLNVALHVGVCLLAVWAGHAIGTALGGRSAVA